MRSWMMIDGRAVFIRPTTKLGVRRAAIAALKRGLAVTAAYLGGSYAIALSPKVYP